MEQEEFNGLVWGTLAEQAQPVSVADLAKLAGQALVKVQTVVSRLRNHGLVEVVQAQPMTVQVARELDPLRWAQAASLGVDLLLLERHARLSASARAEALRISTDGTLERVERRRQQEKSRARASIIEGRAASKAAATDLAQILRDTQAAQAAATPPKNARERAIAALLNQASAEAEKALEGLKRSLAAK